LVKQVEAASEKLRSLDVKHERAVQIGKEKICFTSFNKHELAVFLPNSVGHYEAVNCNCPHYFLAEESVLLFRHHQPENAHKYIVGQIVHIDHNVARPPSPESVPGGLSEGRNEGGATWNPFGLPLGTDYFVVTVAMVPDFTTSLHRTTSS
jgi:autophagy-related protein 11